MDSNDLTSSPEKKNTSKMIEPHSAKKRSKLRHKVTFMDEVTGDEKQLTTIHYVESYKEYMKQEICGIPADPYGQTYSCCSIF